MIKYGHTIRTRRANVVFDTRIAGVTRPPYRRRGSNNRSQFRGYCSFVNIGGGGCVSSKNDRTLSHKPVTGHILREISSTHAHVVFPLRRFLFIFTGVRRFYFARHVFSTFVYRTFFTVRCLLLRERAITIVSRVRIIRVRHDDV